MTLRRLTGALALVFALAASPASAQFAASADLGVAHFSEDPLGRGNLAVLAPTMQLFRPGAHLIGAGAFAVRENGSVGGSGMLNAGARLFGREANSLEVGVTGGGIRFAGFDRAAYLAGELRIVQQRGGHSLSVGVTRGETWVGDRLRPIWSAQLTAAQQLGPIAAALSLTGHRFRPLDPLVDIVSPPTRSEYASAGDLEASLRWWRGRLELGVAGIGRVGRVEDRGVGGQADATLWLNDRLAVVGSVGRQLDDLLRGVGRTRFATLSLRIASAPRWKPTPPPTELSVLDARRDSRGLVLRVRAPRASRVELSGDLTAWSAMPFAAVEPGVWELTLPNAAPGASQVQWRLDGGEWTAPPGLPARPGEFGGTVGVLVVP